MGNSEHFFVAEQRGLLGDWEPTDLHSTSADAMQDCDGRDDRRWHRQPFTPHPDERRYVLLTGSWPNLRTSPPQNLLDIPPNLEVSSLEVGEPMMWHLDNGLLAVVHDNRIALRQAGDADSCKWTVLAEQGAQSTSRATRFAMDDRGLGVMTLSVQAPLRLVRGAIQWPDGEQTSDN